MAILKGGITMMPLGMLLDGEEAEIMHIHKAKGLCHGACRNRDGEGNVRGTEEMGIRIGKKVEMLRGGGGGPVLVKIDESRIAIGRGIAMKILVRRKER